MSERPARTRTDFTGSVLVRLLVRLTDIDVPESRHGFADRLSRWLGWTEAISLADALDGGSSGAAASTSGAPSAEERECARVRSVLIKALAENAVGAATEFPAFQRRYFAKQQAMENGIGPLRTRLRAALAARSPALARLAAVDAVMDKMLSARERSLLAGVPALLEKHFERQRQAEGGLAAFGTDVDAVLRAELEVRMQPVEGLLEALRNR